MHKFQKHICSGVKRYETRKYSAKAQQALEKGYFLLKDETTQVRYLITILNGHRFRSYGAMLDKLPTRRIAPGLTRRKLEDLYRKIGYTTPLIASKSHAVTCGISPTSQSSRTTPTH